MKKVASVQRTDILPPDMPVNGLSKISDIILSVLSDTTSRNFPRFFHYPQTVPVPSVRTVILHS